MHKQQADSNPPGPDAEGTQNPPPMGRPSDQTAPSESGANSRVRREKSPPTHAHDPGVRRTTIKFLYEKNGSTISDTIREYHISRDNIIFWSGCIYARGGGGHMLTGGIEL